MFEFVPLVVLASFILKIIDFVKYARARDINAIVTQLVTWLAGILAVAWAAQTTLADEIMPDLAAMNFATQALVGVALASTASLIVDARKAVDNSQSAAVPPLVPPPTPR